MARTEGRLRTKLWTDRDFLALSFPGKGAYESLLCQPDVEYTGVMPLRPRRLAKLFGLPLEELVELLEELEDARFIVIDWDAEELLVRTFIRNDEVYRQPNLMRSARRSLDAVSSLRLRSEILTELHRIEAEHADSTPEGSRGPLREMIADLQKDEPIPSGGFEDDTGQPKPEGSAEGGPEGSSEPYGEPQPEPTLEGMTGKGGSDPKGVRGRGRGVSSRSVVTQGVPAKADHESEDPDFAAWYEIYPRKVARGRARTAWRKAVKKTTPRELTAALEHYLDRWREIGTKTEYIPHPATWLNGECWADEFGSPELHTEQRGVDIWA